MPIFSAPKIVPTTEYLFKYCFSIQLTEFNILCNTFLLNINYYKIKEVIL